MTASLKFPVGPDDHIKGRLDAPITLVEYGDFECPNCGRAYGVVKAVHEEMRHWLRVVFRHFPLSELHPHAETAAEAAEAAGDRGKFWHMHDLLFEHQDALEHEDLIRYAGSLGIDAEWTEGALRTRTYAEDVREDFLGGVRSGVNGTPTYFINGARHDGPSDGQSLLAALQTVLYVSGRT